MWKMPPSVVIPPVIEPRTTARAAPGLLAGVRQRLRPAHADAAPSATAKPTTNAVCELDVIAAAKIGASEETVPSIMPTSAGLDDAQHEVALVGETRAVDPARDQRVRARWGAVSSSVLITATA